MPPIRIPLPEDHHVRVHFAEVIGVAVVPHAEVVGHLVVVPARSGDDVVPVGDEALSQELPEVPEAHDANRELALRLALLLERVTLPGLGFRVQGLRVQGLEIRS